LIEQGLTSH